MIFIKKEIVKESAIKYEACFKSSPLNTPYPATSQENLERQGAGKSPHSHPDMQIKVVLHQYVEDLENQ